MVRSIVTSAVGYFLIVLLFVLVIGGGLLQVAVAFDVAFDSGIILGFHRPAMLLGGFAWMVIALGAAINMGGNVGSTSFGTFWVIVVVTGLVWASIFNPNLQTFTVWANAIPSALFLGWLLRTWLEFI